jgi:7-cyano-7-deazaguanine synthase in queuosine biosynthesis
MVANLPALYADLLEIATYVHCAEQTTPRGGKGARGLGTLWRRNMCFVIPVRKPDFWARQEVKGVIEELLGFLSDDNYDFRFTMLENPPPVDTYFESLRGETGFQADEIVLFSGGLDSLAGAIKEVLIDGNCVALVSHRSAPKIAPKQRELHAELCKRCPSELRPMHIPVWIQKHGWDASDNNQRTRSFLYASLGATIAGMFGRNRIRFYENGITSLNLPIGEQVLGARATRTTHPKSIAGFRDLFSLICGESFEVDAPFLWNTKTDVVELIRNAGQSDLMKYAVSCSHVWAMTKLNTHCGCCSQCIDRRLAMFASDCIEHDPDEMYKTDVFVGEKSKETQDIVLAESYIRSARECANMTEIQFFSRYGELARVVPYIGDNSDKAAARIFQLFGRNAVQIKNAITNAVKYYADQLAGEAIPDQCLLRQLFGTKLQPKGVQSVRDKRMPTAKANRKAKKSAEKSALISALLTHHKFSEAGSQDELNFNPAKQEELGSLLGWDQSKVCRVIQRSLRAGFWERYLNACKSEALFGFLKRLDDETTDVESIYYRPSYPTEREQKDAGKYE